MTTTEKHDEADYHIIALALAVVCVFVIVCNSPHDVGSAQTKYLLIEAEDASYHTLLSGYYPSKYHEPDGGFSGGRCLRWVGSQWAMPSDGWTAVYEFVMPLEGKCDIVARITFPKGESLPSIRYSLDGSDTKPASVVPLDSSLVRITTEYLTIGWHTLRLSFTPQSSTSSFLLDTVCIAQSPAKASYLNDPRLAVAANNFILSEPVDVIVDPSRGSTTVLPLSGIAVYSGADPSVTQQVRYLDIKLSRCALYFGNTFPLPDLYSGSDITALKLFFRDHGILTEDAAYDALLERGGTAREFLDLLIEKHITFSSPVRPDWSAIDTRLAELQSCGVTTVIITGEQVPIWLSSNQRDLSRVLLYPPNNTDAYREIWRQAVEHVHSTFPDLIVLWEVGNEPDLPDFFISPNPIPDYLSMYRTAVQGVRSADQNALVGGPAVSGGMPSVEWLSALVSADVPLDFLSWHMYDKQPDEVRMVAGLLRDLLDTSGHTDTSLLIDEWNVSGQAPYDSAHRDLFDTSYNSANVVSTLIGMADGGLDMSVFFYDKDQSKDVSYGVLTQDGKVKPVYSAFEAISILAKGHPISVLQSDYYKISSYAVRRDDGSVFLVLSNHDASESVPRRVKVNVLGAGTMDEFTLQPNTIMSVEVPN